MADLLYRVQAGDGRGPWRPGLSRLWVDHERTVFQPSVLEEFGQEWPREIPFGWSAGCACRSLHALYGWFTPIEMGRLETMGYTPVEFIPDKIIRESDLQVVFARRKPLQSDVTILRWPVLAVG